MAQLDAVIITPAEFPRDREVVEKLFVAYTDSLGIDLAYQNFKDELAQLPGKYATNKRGALLLASTSTSTSTSTLSASTITADSTSISTSKVETAPKTIGCVALRLFSAPHVCELKRLYISPDSRGLGAGRILLEAAIIKAKELGYKEMLLDTLSSMVAARKLYAKYGFQEVEKYYDSPIEGTVFMKAML